MPALPFNDPGSKRRRDLQATVISSLGQAQPGRLGIDFVFTIDKLISLDLEIDGEDEADAEAPWLRLAQA